MMGKEALVVITKLSQLMVAKMDKPILHIKGWNNERIEIAVIWFYSQAIRGAQAPSPFQTQDINWPSG